MLLTLPLSATAQGIDREAAYKKALPLYQYDVRQPLSVKITETHALGNARLQRFTYQSVYYQTVPALLFTPMTEAKSHPVPCLILLHGLGGSKEMMAGMALAAVQNGYAALAIDEAGQGERPPMAQKKSATPSAALAWTVWQTALDVRRGLDYLGTRRDINSQKIGLVGLSLGAMIGTVTAGVDPRIKAVALISGGGDWGLIMKTLTARHATVGGHSTAGFAGANWNEVSAGLAPEDPLTFAAHIAPRALLMLHGRKDDVIVPQAAQKLYDAAWQPKTIQWFAPYGHVPPPEVVYPALKAFFKQRL